MKKRLLPYWQALLDIFKYQVVTKFLIGIWLFALGYVFRLLLRSTGRVALSSGDFAFIFTKWQGWLIIVAALVSLFLYMAFDLNTKIVLSRNLLEGKPGTLRDCEKEAFLSIRRFMEPRGIGVVLYVALIAPVLGFGMSISLTEGLYIPTFITSVIHSTPLYLVLVSALMAAFLIIGLSNLFILHGVILDHLSVREAGKQSKRLMKKNWRDYLKQNVLYAVVTGLLLVAVVIATVLIPVLAAAVLPVSESVKRGLVIFFTLAGSALTGLAALFATPLYVMKVTQLFYTYKQEEKRLYPARERKKHPFVWSGVIVAAVGILLGTVVMNRYFEEMFPAEVTVGIIAHRGGGNEGPENTVAGLETAYKAGASGSEIDIQRTKDSYYIVNHDSDFKRVAGDSRKPEEMTLAEVKELDIGGEQVPTFEEMLAASRGKLVLFTELKGSTADRQMADDAVRIIKEQGMEEGCVLISLKYDLIDYIESTYPEIQTGYLTWVSFGNTAALNCDYLGLEEESATTDAISAIHDQGKKALVWTVNSAESQKHFLCSDADGMITDNIFPAADVMKELEARTDAQRIWDKLLNQ